ncbi:MAG: division/cell wall cluster transcriptional repressor MraZ [Acidobacteria bacterium]|nr:division/cell wall cluster transcriptional repressor MraZ [Acidobacteriota bacterium]
MLCGSYTAKIDEKFRLKIPAKFRRELPETEDNNFYVTSDDGKCAQIYPIPVWERIAQKFQEPPRMDPAKIKLQKFTSYYGILTQMDPQGRILIPQALREDAQIYGDVVVMAKNDHLEVWNSETIRTSLKEDPMTNADRERLAEQGF